MLDPNANRKQFCIPLLISIHELAPIVAELRQAHDDLWARQKYFFQLYWRVKRINRLFETAGERAARAGSELSIDPAGQNVMDAYLAYLKAQGEYIQAIIKPMNKFYTRPFNKANISTLDELSQKANDKLTALEEAIRIFVGSPTGSFITTKERYTMPSLDPQTTQQIIQLLATYGPPAGIAAAQAAASGAVQALGGGAAKAVKSLWEKIHHKSGQVGGMAEVAVTSFAATPNDPETQQVLSIILGQLCQRDPAFEHEITQLFNEVQRDRVAGQFIQHISRSAQVGVAGVNYGQVNFHQTIHQGSASWRESINANLNEFVLLWTVIYGKKEDNLIEPTLSDLQRKIINISDKLIRTLSRTSRDIPAEVRSTISGIAAQLETLGRLQFYMDGGLSVNTFNELGDRVEKDAANLIDWIHDTE